MSWRCAEAGAGGHCQGPEDGHSADFPFIPDHGASEQRLPSHHEGKILFHPICDFHFSRSLLYFAVRLSEAMRAHHVWVVFVVSWGFTWLQSSSPAYQYLLLKFWRSPHWQFLSMIECMNLFSSFTPSNFLIPQTFISNFSSREVCSSLHC